MKPIKNTRSFKHAMKVVCSNIVRERMADVLTLIMNVPLDDPWKLQSAIEFITDYPEHGGDYAPSREMQERWPIRALRHEITQALFSAADRPVAAYDSEIRLSYSSHLINDTGFTCVRCSIDDLSFELREECEAVHREMDDLIDEGICLSDCEEYDPERTQERVEEGVNHVETIVEGKVEDMIEKTLEIIDEFMDDWNRHCLGEKLTEEALEVCSHLLPEPTPIKIVPDVAHWIPWCQGLTARGMEEDHLNEAVRFFWLASSLPDLPVQVLLKLASGQTLQEAMQEG